MEGVNAVSHSLVHSLICYYSQPTVFSLTLAPPPLLFYCSVLLCTLVPPCVAFGYITRAVDSNPFTLPLSLSPPRMPACLRPLYVAWAG